MACSEVLVSALFELASVILIGAIILLVVVIGAAYCVVVELYLSVRCFMALVSRQCLEGQNYLPCTGARSARAHSPSRHPRRINIELNWDMKCG
jgi:hypothetical protein